MVENYWNTGRVTTLIHSAHSHTPCTTDMTSEEAKSLEETMVEEISSTKMTISDRTARKWLRQLGFKFCNKVVFYLINLHHTCIFCRLSHTDFLYAGEEEEGCISWRTRPEGRSEVSPWGLFAKSEVISPSNSFCKRSYWYRDWHKKLVRSSAGVAGGGEGGDMDQPGWVIILCQRWRGGHMTGSGQKLYRTERYVCI